MTQQQKLSEILILMGGIAFLVGVLLKITAQTILFLPIAYWRFAMGCFALSVALSLHKIAEKK